MATGEETSVGPMAGPIGYGPLIEPIGYGSLIWPDDQQ